VQVELRAEDVKRAADEAHRSVGMTACAPAVSLTQPAPQQACAGDLTGGYLLQLTGDGRQAEDARTALSGRFISKIPGDAGRFG
jgi:hypothetical protein